MKRYYLLFTCLFIQILAKAQTYPSNIEQKIHTIENSMVKRVADDGKPSLTLKQLMAKYKVKGISIAVIHNYKLEWAKGYGWADEKRHIPVTAQTLFEAGSISKSLNAVGVLKLAQTKKLNLFADINQYLTSWKFPYSAVAKGRHITMANLLSHTAGLTVHGFPGYETGKPLPGIVQILDGKKPANSPAVRSEFEPGLKFQYSGGGITIAQLMVMDITHQPYAQYMFDNVLKPLGMLNSTYAQPPVNIKPELLAAGYDETGKAIASKYHVYPEQAAAGLWTNPTDLSKFIIEVQQAYAGRSAKVLNHQTTQLMLAPYLNQSAAMGVFIDDYNGVKYFEHSGVDEGFISHYYGSFNNGDGVVVMINTNNMDIISQVINTIAGVYHFNGLYRAPKKQVKLSADAMKGFAGKYVIANPAMTLNIIVKKDHLLITPTGDDAFTVYPEGQNKFFAKDFNVDIEFVRSANGQVNGITLTQDGAKMAGKKAQ